MTMTMMTSSYRRSHDDEHDGNSSCVEAAPSFCYFIPKEQGQQPAPQHDLPQSLPPPRFPLHLAIPWIFILVVAATGAIYTQYNSVNLHTHDDNVASMMMTVFGGNDNNSSDNDSNSYEKERLRFLSTSSTTLTKDDHVYHEEHEPLFPLDWTDYWGFFLATLGLMVAAGGGIGGGGILVPIYALVMGFSPKHAIPLSNITVFGGSIANTILNLQKRHPLADRPLIDWDLILVMEPLTIAGALIGAFLNKILPELFLTVMLVILLSVTARTTLQKAVKMYKKETQEQQKQLQVEAELIRTHLLEQERRHRQARRGQYSSLHNDDDDDDGDGDGEHLGYTDRPQQEGEGTAATTPARPAETEAKAEVIIKGKDLESGKPKREIMSISKDGGEETGATSDAEKSTPVKNQQPARVDHDDDIPLQVDEAELELERRRQQELEQILLEEKQQVPLLNIMILFTLFFVVLSINLLKGGGAFPSPLGIKCGSQGFWVSNFVMLGWILVISLLVRGYLVKRYEQKKRCGYQYVEGDIQWDSRATLVYPFLCCFAGFFAGMFGVGGGIVKGPLMLAMNVHPAVSSASSACMILFTSFTAATSFVVFGLLVEDYAVVCLLIGFVATFVGQVGLSYLARKAQRNSYIAFSIGFVVLISAFLMTVQSLLSMAEGEQHHSGGICGKSD